MRTAGNLRIGWIEPHLRVCGGIRRAVEFANRLTARGHHVTFYVPDDQPLECGWMPCHAAVKPLSVGTDDRLDILLFNEESQWHLLDRFTRARRRILYALHYARLYQKAGSWECLRADVDLRLANSTWTADQIEAEIGQRPVVQLGGVNRQVFRPYGGPKRYPLLCSGAGPCWWWKGTSTIVEAGRLAGLPLEGYTGWNLSQPELGRAYDAAETFVVGSWFEGFCQPGLESLASGVPLVTTDNGGNREYAIDGETALVVPARDPASMARAIERMRGDPELAATLVANGLDLVGDRFDWETRTDELEATLDGVVAAPAAPRSAPTTGPADPEPAPDLSVVVLAWDNLWLTQRCCETVRQHTDCPYELVIVDNGSEWEAATYAAQAADTPVLNKRNLGFAGGMNRGRQAARGTWIAFCNNDIRLPEHWASMLLETARAHPDAGIVVPSITAGVNPLTVRSEPGPEVHVLPPFSAPPPAVVYLMRADLFDALGGWNEQYPVASGEDVDLAFTAWVNDLDIVHDERVLVEHIGKATATRLDDWQQLWANNRMRFHERWLSDSPVPRVPDCPPERHARNRRTAGAVASWMARSFDAERLARPTTPAEPAAMGVPLRTRQARGWLSDLQALPPAAPELVRTPDGRVFVIEGSARRRVTSSLLSTVLEARLGGMADISYERLEPLVDVPPVEVLDTGTHARPPFVVLGGERVALKGLPVTHPVARDDAEHLPLGDPIDLGTVLMAGTPRSGPDDPLAAALRRADRARTWVEGLRSSAPAPSHLVRGPRGRVHLIESGTRRPVHSGLLATLLAQILGPPRDGSDVGDLVEGPPVEVLERDGSEPFVVVFGRRLPVRGLPLPHAVDGLGLDEIPEGTAFDVNSLLPDQLAHAIRQASEPGQPSG